MRLEELRTALSEQADQVHDQGPVGRVGSVRDRIRTTRRRRTSGAVGGVAAAVAAILIGGAVLGGTEQSTAPPVAHDQHSDPQPDQVRFAASFAGRTLLSSTVGAQGAHGRRLIVDLTSDRDLLFTGHCWHAGRDAMLHLAASGDELIAMSCRRAGAAADVGQGTSTTMSASSLREGLGLAAGEDRVRLRAWVTSGRRGGAPAPDVRLALGVYAMPRPVTTLAGRALYPRERYDGRDWQLASYATSDPGSRRYESTVTGPGEGFVVVSTQFTGTRTVRIFVDGKEETSFTGPGGGGTEVLLPSAARHRVEVRVARPPDDTRIGIAIYLPVLP